MILSNRLQTLAEFLPKCACLADIGTDHGYIPIYAIKNKICETAIASDIKQGPVEIAIRNINSYDLGEKIETRLGGGLSIIKTDECDVIVISGMGGNLISEIIENDIEKARSARFLILQPVQYPEELRRYLIHNNFNIVDETMANEENKYYPIIKASSGVSSPYDKEVFYYTGKIMVDNKHPVLYKYIKHKIHRLNIILNELQNSENIIRRDEIIKLISEFEEVKTCLDAAMK